MEVHVGRHLVCCLFCIDLYGKNISIILLIHAPLKSLSLWTRDAQRQMRAQSDKIANVDIRTFLDTRNTSLAKTQGENPPLTSPSITHASPSIHSSLSSQRLHAFRQHLHRAAILHLLSPRMCLNKKFPTGATPVITMPEISLPRVLRSTRGHIRHLSVKVYKLCVCLRSSKMKLGQFWHVWSRGLKPLNGMGVCAVTNWPRFVLRR